MIFFPAMSGCVHAFIWSTAEKYTINLRFKGHSWPWKHGLRKQSHHKVHLVAVPELSILQYHVVLTSRWCLSLLHCHGVVDVRVSEYTKRISVQLSNLTDAPVDYSVQAHVEQPNSVQTLFILIPKFQKIPNMCVQNDKDIEDISTWWNGAAIKNGYIWTCMIIEIIFPTLKLLVGQKNLMKQGENGTPSIAHSCSLQCHWKMSKETEGERG